MRAKLLFRSLSVFILCSVSLSAIAETPPELLLNGGFENGDIENPWDEGKTPYSWFKWSDSWGWAAWKYDALSGIPAHSGTKYLVAGSGSSNEFGLWGQNIIVTEGTSYSFSVWARTEGWHPNPEASMLVDFKNASGTIILTDTYDIFTGSIPNPNVWAKFTMTTRPAPAGAATANFCVRGDLGSPIFDDASVVVPGPDPDFNYDKTVNNLDMVKLSYGWLTSSGLDGYDPICDLDEDGNIDLDDFSLFAESWLWFDNPVVANIDETSLYQEMDGFGASFTDSSAWLVHDFLYTPDYLDLMEELFDPGAGIGLSYLRQPMGTSDMRRKPDYSYDDVPPGSTDYPLSYFSIDQDRDYIIPVLKKAMELNPDIKIMGSPWSPPPWMKTNSDFPGGQLIDTDAIYNSYAEYFVKYVQAYEAEGITIDAVTLQNEPGLEIGYPSLNMSASDQIKLIKKVGPRFQAEGIDAKIVIYDFNWDNTGFPLSVLGNTQARAYIDGVAWHHYGGDVSAQTTVHNAYPAKGTYFTEGAIGEWAHPEGDFDGCLIHAANLIIDTTRNWAKCVVLWNMALHELYNGPITPGENGCWTCFGLITIDSNTRAITRNSPFYALGHISKYVKSGARRIDSNDTSATPVKNVAFVNTDGSIVVFALNRATDARNFQVNWNGSSFIYPVPGRSVTTFTWPDQQDPTVDVWVTTGDKRKLLEQENSIQFQE
ncbi:MAG: carbohydrate binding domain-containing protein [Sedimentisphaerales bacterium]|nr:carbohydrate binding domain-containing protein [Sedimentisphaerales bacterium]